MKHEKNPASCFLHPALYFMINLILTGAAGRMGQAILNILPSFKDINLIAAIESNGHPHIGEKIYKDIKLTSDLACHCACPPVVWRKSAIGGRGNPSHSLVLLDFTNAEASVTNLKIAASSKVPAVLCATGHNSDQRAEITALSKKIPVVFSPNMSVGVNVMLKLISGAASALGNDYKIDIVETHHVHKKDAPSGTAKKMLEIVGTPARINVKSIREGEVVGDHAISFTSPYEKLEITHRAFSREVFANGALRAALWVVNKPAGLYDMGDVLRIKS